ncbi:alpha/beta-Hydrolase [Apiospora hydei]|uniref:Cutinase n=1 Tax=Apiospora hydei TaxID=1337664 RepID=A0ABR1W9V0_9PEZI
MKLLNLVTLSLSLLPAASGAPLAAAAEEGPVATLPIITKRQNQPINQLLSYITQLFPVNIALEDGAALLTLAEKAFAILAGFSTTENDVQNGRCGDVVVVFARGTTEPGQRRTLAVQGVDRYEASVTGYLQGGDASGSQQMANLVSKAFKQCPSSKIVISGYSQGGQLVHNAAKLLPAATMAAVSSVVIFGDPYSKFPVQGASPNKVSVVCHLGDDICVNGDLVLLSHLTYLTDASAAATYILAQANRHAHPSQKARRRRHLTQPTDFRTWTAVSKPTAVAAAATCGTAAVAAGGPAAQSTTAEARGAVAAPPRWATSIVIYVPLMLHGAAVVVLSVIEADQSVLPFLSDGEDEDVEAEPYDELQEQVRHHERQCEHEGEGGDAGAEEQYPAPRAPSAGNIRASPVGEHGDGDKGAEYGVRAE